MNPVPTPAFMECQAHSEDYGHRQVVYITVKNRRGKYLWREGTSTRGSNNPIYTAVMKNLLLQQFWRRLGAL